MNEEPDFIDTDNFDRLTKHAKLIEFGKEFEARPDSDKITYLVKLASSLNHAAAELQKERNQLNDLLFTKEAQLVSCQKQREQERMMIQHQLENENKAKQILANENQSLRNEIKVLVAEVKELKNGTCH